ncbi:MAG: hypothetical protein GY796_11630, partial [Chloroflexi bacterium]|nr:hypothetical protein [Chloroflexota bacterium]
AMAKNPADRYLSAKEMAQALAKCLVKPQLAAPAEPEVVVLMDTQPLVVAPGNSLTHKITLHNKGGQEDRCQVRVEGIPPEWVSISPSAATLAPEQRQEVEIAIYPPRAPQSRAGRYPTSIQVISQQSSKQVDEIKTILTVASYSQFSCALWPQEISTSQISKVTIENQGNAPETFTVTPTPDKGLGFKPEQARVKVAAGESNTAGFAVSSQRQLLVAR